jgi:hypothetical protein
LPLGYEGLAEEHRDRRSKTQPLRELPTNALLVGSDASKFTFYLEFIDDSSSSALVKVRTATELRNALPSREGEAV